MNDCTCCYPGWTCPWCEWLADKANRIERDALWARCDARKQADPFYAWGDEGEHSAPEWHQPTAAPHW